MRAWFIALLFALMLLPTAVFAANDIDKDDLTAFNSLTDVQKAEIAVQIARTAEGNANNVKDNILDTNIEPERLDEWINIGARIGKMLGSTAKELGVAANDFAASRLGVITIGLIIWNYAGSDLYGFILGVLWLGILIPIWTILFFKIAYPVSEYVDYKRKARFSDDIVTVSKPIRKFTRNNGDAVPAAIFTIAIAIILIVGTIFLA